MHHLLHASRAPCPVTVVEVHPLTLHYEGADAVLSGRSARCGLELMCLRGLDLLGPSSLLLLLVLLPWWSVK